MNTLTSCFDVLPYRFMNREPVLCQEFQRLLNNGEMTIFIEQETEHNCWYNAQTKSFWGILKNELSHHKICQIS